MNGIKNASLFLIDRPPVNDIHIDSKQYIVSAATATVEGIAILCIYFYNVEREITYSVYLNRYGDKPSFTTYDHVDNKFREACICNLFDGYYWAYHDDKFVYDCELSARAGNKYFNEPCRLTLDCANGFQVGLRDYRLQLRMDNDHRQIDALMEQVPPLPADLEKWIDDVALLESRYAYYRREKNIIIGFCTHCSREFKMDAPRGTLVNKTGICPLCGSQITFKSETSSASVRDDTYINILNRISDGIIISEYKVCRNHSREEFLYGYEQHIYPVSRVFISMNYICKYYIYECRNCKFCNNTRWYRYNERLDDYRYGQYRQLYPYNVADALKDTPWIHTALDIYAASGITLHVLNYLRHCERYPVIEKLVKMKLYNLVYDSFRDTNVINHIENPKVRVQDALGMNMADIHFFAEINAKYKEIQLIKYCRTIGRKCDEVDIKDIRRFDHDYSDKIENDPIRKPLHYTTIYKLCRYICEQYDIDQLLRKKDRHYVSYDIVLNDWQDYIKDCGKLGYDIKESCILMPRVLSEAHRGTSAAISAIENADKDEAIKAILPELEETYNYSDDSFFIRPARSAAELIEEGRQMDHCVARYIDKMAEGDCTILFIRRLSDPDAPVATVEVDGMRVIQIRAFKDRIPEKSVEAFFNKYTKTVLNKNKNNEEVSA